MSAPAPIRILLVDDHPVVLEGLRGLLDTQPGMEVVGEAEGLREALDLSRRLQPDLTLLDLRLPDVRGTEGITALLKENRRARIIVLSTYGTEGEIHSALAAGAMGYLLKDAPLEELVAAIRSVAGGERFLSHHAAERLAAAPSRAQLTEKEIQILQLIGEGRNNAEIAQTLRVEVGTVKTHVHAILGKLDARDRTAAVAVALKQGLIQLGL